MRLRKRNNKVRGKTYPRYELELTQNEAIRLEKLGMEYEIEDIDPKGWVSLRLKVPTTIGLLPPPKTPISLDLNLSKDQWDRFKGNLKRNGLTTCQAVSNYVSAVNESVDRLGDYPTITVVNVWQGVPRSRSQKLLSRGVSELV